MPVVFKNIGDIDNNGALIIIFRNELVSNNLMAHRHTKQMTFSHVLFTELYFFEFSRNVLVTKFQMLKLKHWECEVGRHAKVNAWKGEQCGRIYKSDKLGNTKLKGCK